MEEVLEREMAEYPVVIGAQPMNLLKAANAMIADAVKINIRRAIAEAAGIDPLEVANSLRSLPSQARDAQDSLNSQEKALREVEDELKAAEAPLRKQAEEGKNVEQRQAIFEELCRESELVKGLRETVGDQEFVIAGLKSERDMHLNSLSANRALAYLIAGLAGGTH